MPQRCKKTCSKPGCPTATTAGHRFCAAHTREQQAKYDAKRGTAVERGYGPNWRRLRALILRRDPICRWPGGCRMPSTDVDHIVAKRKGGTDEASNLRGLCGYHHGVKTVREDGALKRANSLGKTDHVQIP